MSFFSSSPQPRFTTDEGLEDFIRTKAPGSPSKISSVNNSMGDHQNQDSPLKHTDLSPVYRDQSDSVYSLNPTSYFAASPVPKIVVTETMKIGSGRKSKENGLILSPDPSSSQNENYKKVVIMSPPKKGYSVSPKKENIQKSPHRLAEMYSSPSEGPDSKRKSSSLEDQQSQHESLDDKKPLSEINITNLRNPPATSYAGMPAQKGANNPNYVGSAIEGQEEEQAKQQRGSLPASPGDRIEQPGLKVYATTHSPKSKLREYEEDEEPIIIQDTPTARKTIEFGNPEEQQERSHPDVKTQDFDLRRFRGENEAPKKSARPSYEGNRNPVIPEVSLRAENLESSSMQKGESQLQNPSARNSASSTAKENLLQARSAAESPKSHRGAAKVNQSRISSRHSDRSFDSRIENWTVDNFTMFPGTDPQKAAEIQDRANNIIKTLRKSRDKFSDIIFLPTLTSLVNSIKRNKKPEWKAFEWLRLSELYKQLKPTLYEEISPLNLRPGLLKNYGFLTVVAALAEFPEIVRNLIHNQVYNAEGCYSVKVCRDGAWKSIVVDDLIPVTKESNKIAAKPAFLRVQNDDKKIDIWPQIYEKAWAKVFDTYQNLEVTSVDQMLRNSLGAPCITHEIEDQEETWNVLSEAFTHGHIVIASIKSDKSDLSNDEIYKKGLNPLYGNTILDISLTATGPSGARTVTLRNIWNDEYAWESGNKESQKDKIIVMTLQEFCSIYTHLNVSQYNENYVYRSTTMRHVHQAYSVVKFRCLTRTECFFETVQIDHTFYRGDPGYQYSNSRLLIFKLDGDKGTLMGRSVSDSKCNTLRINLDDGDYYIIGNMDWKGEVHDFTLSSYSSAEIKFERVHYRENPELLSQLLEQLFVDNGIPKILLKNKDFVKYEKVFPELNCKGELFINNSSVKTLHIHKKVSKIQNANLVNATLGENNDIKVTLLPQTSKVFLFGAEDLSKVSTYISEDIVHDSLK